MREQLKKFFLYLMAAFYAAAGIVHLIRPSVFQSIVPPYLPWPNFLIFLSGVAEILLGIALIYQKTRVIAAWGIIALLLAVFPANIYMYQYRSTVFQSIPDWILLLRLPLQGLLIWAAYYWTKPRA